MSQPRTNITKIKDFLFLIEPIWVLTATTLVYLSVILDWPSLYSWIFLGLAFTHFPFRLLRFGYPTQRTPFDIPILVLLFGMIAGTAASEQFNISLGAFQTFLAATASYYSIVNYSKPSWLIMIGLPAVAVIVLAFAIKWAFSDINVPHGLDIALAIIGFIVLGIAIFAKQTIQRIVSGFSGLILLAVAVLYTHESLDRFSTLGSIKSRMPIWENVINSIEGHRAWTGLGLGSWSYVWMKGDTVLGHVHNAYIELYVNTGVLGLFALICFMAVGAKLTFDTLYSPRSSPYYGFGIGVIMATLAVFAVSFVESAPFGFGLLYKGSYHYILSPIPFILAGLLVIARQLLRENTTAEDGVDHSGDTQ